MTIKEIAENIYLGVVNIKEIDDELKKLIDQKLISICEGNSKSDLIKVKKRVLNFLKSKNEKMRKGAVAEFFVHLYLILSDYKQECMFFNLEENSIKKGFDGYYSKQNEEWIMESKSGNINSESVSHKSKVREAYNDLKTKLDGAATNNPWRNAYNHASHMDVGSEESIRLHIKKLSDEYDDDVYHNIKDFNIIPGSTIFLNGKWIENNINVLEEDIEELVKNFDFNNIIVLCITKKSLNLFINYLIN
ncbi:MAG: hypothetical protein FXF54_08250 [Kosmotoga sp.]|nr:MAG: hypothetical protein FXF54_08250 [Kosmotoga sp.]